MLSGRTILVTGAARGLGREIALALANAGARLLLADIDESGLAETDSAAKQVVPQASTTKSPTTDSPTTNSPTTDSENENGRGSLMPIVLVAGVAILILFGVLFVRSGKNNK